MDTVLMSVDSSTTSTGVAIYKNGKLTNHYTVSKDKKEKMEHRIQSMISDLYEIIETYNPNILVPELTVVPRNAEAQRNLSMLLGALLGKCVEKDIFWYPYRPSVWRNIVKNDDENIPTGRDNKKKWACNKVKQLYGLDLNDDESEAILIGLAYIKQFGN